MGGTIGVGKKHIKKHTFLMGGTIGVGTPHNIERTNPGAGCINMKQNLLKNCFMGGGGSSKPCILYIRYLYSSKLLGTNIFDIRIRSGT